MSSMATVSGISRPTSVRRCVRISVWHVFSYIYMLSLRKDFNVAVSCFAVFALTGL